MEVVDITSNVVRAMLLILWLSLPPIVVASVVGVLFSLIQALTQIQEQTLSFGVKLIAVGLTLYLTSRWIGGEIYNYTLILFDHFHFWFDKMEKSVFEFSTTWLISLFLSMPRILAIFTILPMFSRQALPGLLRIGVAFSVAIFVVPLLINEAPTIFFSPIFIISLVLKEMLIGFILGFIISLPIWAFDIMGAYVDNQRGASIAATINPLTGHDTSPLGELFSQVAVTFLLLSGGYFLILTVIFESFGIWPVFKFLPSFNIDTPEILLAQMDRLMSIAVLLSAPVIFAMFLAEFGLGLVSRFVPQLQVFFMAMPIKSALAFFIFSIYTNALLSYASDQFDPIGKIAIDVITEIFK